MFEEFSRELRRLGLDQGVEIPIELPLDEKGYLDRECPHRECGAEFKVIFDDWRDKVPGHAAFCPKCGVQDDPTNFISIPSRRRDTYRKWGKRTLRTN